MDICVLYPAVIGLTILLYYFALKMILFCLKINFRKEKNIKKQIICIFQINHTTKGINNQSHINSNVMVLRSILDNLSQTSLPRKT